MAEVYGARPPYPEALINAVAALAAPVGPRVVELGAGIGHFALALAGRGLDVVAVEPARAMFERLQLAAAARGLPVRAVRAAAESLPFTEPSFELALIADAIHFMNVERTAFELRRVLVPGAALVIVTAELANTPLMNGVRRLFEGASAQRPRDTDASLRRLATLADVELADERSYHDETPIDPGTLELILRSYSFVGPAMAPEALTASCRALHAASDAPNWARTLTLHAGHLRRRSTPWEPRPRKRGRPCSASSC